MSSPVIIEVALNGATRRSVNALAPETPEQLAADGIACVKAGASIVHTHNSDRSAPAAEAAEEYIAGLRPIREAFPEVALYPTMGRGSNISERYDHHKLLQEAGVIDMGALDPGSINLAATSEDTGLPKNQGAYVNSPADIAYMMDVCRERKLGPNMAMWEPGFLRTVLAYDESGRLAPGSFTKFYFTAAGYNGLGMPFYAPPPIPEAFELYHAMIKSTPLPWAVAVLGGSLFGTGLAELALDRGGHLRVGLEDDPLGPSNVEQVARAVELCGKAGRPVATPTEMRSMLGLPS